MLLFCESNPLKRLDVSPCPKLGKLNCVQCDLEELVLTGCKEIFEISCYQNKLTSIDLTEVALYGKGLIRYFIGSLFVIHDLSLETS